MSTITKEQLIEEAKQAVEGCRRLLRVSPDVEAHKISLRLAEIALASLEAEAVAYIFKHPAGRLFWSLTDESNKGQSDVMPVYTAQPAPVFVPDDLAKAFISAIEQEQDRLFGEDYLMDSKDCVDVIREEAQRLNACRAAMLQGADGNSPVIPDGWVACSERMPNIGVPVITCCGDVVQYAAYAWDGKAWQDWYEEYDKLPANTFTHWHPRPAAPQQEVKP